MRALFAQPTLRQALASLVFAVLLLGPLGICCHEHHEEGDRATHGAHSHVCAGICACHFSITISENPSSETPVLQPVYQCAVNEREPLSDFVAGIDHPPKI